MGVVCLLQIGLDGAGDIKPFKIHFYTISPYIYLYTYVVPLFKYHFNTGVTELTFKMRLLTDTKWRKKRSQPLSYDTYLTHSHTKIGAISSENAKMNPLCVNGLSILITNVTPNGDKVKARFFSALTEHKKQMNWRNNVVHLLITIFFFLIHFVCGDFVMLGISFHFALLFLVNEVKILLRDTFWIWNYCLCGWHSQHTLIEFWWMYLDIFEW